MLEEPGLVHERFHGRNSMVRSTDCAFAKPDGMGPRAENGMGSADQKWNQWSPRLTFRVKTNQAE